MARRRLPPGHNLRGEAQRPLHPGIFLVNRFGPLKQLHIDGAVLFVPKPPVQTKPPIQTKYLNRPFKYPGDRIPRGDSLLHGNLTPLKSQTLNPGPKTLNPKHETLNQKP